MDYERFRRLFPRPIRNVMDFCEGFYKAFHYTYVEKGFWYDAGYGLSYALSGWWSTYRDMYCDPEYWKGQGK